MFAFQAQKMQHFRDILGWSDLKKNLEFADTNKQRLLQQHKYKFILVFDEQVVGSYHVYERAPEEGIRAYGPDGNFLVCHVLDEELLDFICRRANIVSLS